MISPISEVISAISPRVYEISRSVGPLDFTHNFLGKIPDLGNHLNTASRARPIEAMYRRSKPPYKSVVSL